MANVFENPEKYAGTALEVLKRTIKGAGLFVHKLGTADFVGAKDSTVNIKRPPVLKAYDAGFRSRNARVISDIVNSSIPVTLTRFPSSEVALSPEELTLDEINYVRDVQSPQVQAIVDDFDDTIAGALRNADFVYEVTYDPNAGEATAAAKKKSDPRKVASRANKHFTDSKVPIAGRYWLVGSAVAEAIRDYDKILDVDTSGLPEALRDGVVTKLSTFIVIEWDALTENESYFAHNTAVAIAAVAPAVPSGAKGGATIAANGLAVTQLWDYDSATKKDHSTVHAFTGANVVKDPEIDEEAGTFNVVDGDVQFEFVRAVKVVFIPVGASDTGNGGASYTISVTGSPTGGTFTLDVDGAETVALPHNVTNTVLRDALNDIEGIAGVKVTGTTTKTIVFTERVTLALDANDLTGGTTPSVTVTAV